MFYALCTKVHNIVNHMGKGVLLMKIKVGKLRILIWRKFICSV